MFSISIAEVAAEQEKSELSNSHLLSFISGRTHLFMSASLSVEKS